MTTPQFEPSWQKTHGSPVEILELMSDAVFVREGVAKNPSTPVRILLKLAASDDKQVRASVAQNPNLPRNTLLQLLADPRDIVRFRRCRKPVLTGGNPGEPCAEPCEHARSFLCAVEESIDSRDSSDATRGES